VFPTPEQGLGILLAAIGIAILLLLAGRGGWRNLSLFGLSFARPRDKTEKELEWDREDRRYAASLDRRQTETAFLRYSEAAVGMVAMVTTPSPANDSLRAWFDLVASAIATALVKQPEDHFRVGIWADLGEPDAFRLLGCCNLNRNEATLRQLSKEATIGGHAFRSKKGEYLSADVKKDRRYKSRSGQPKPYQSIFAIRVGDERPWGVMTIDAPRVNGFTAADLTIIRRFAKLVSAGATVAVAKYSPGARAHEIGGPRRIVAPSGQLPEPPTIEGEAPDDQP
jgi:hypothetical protein